MTRPMGLKFPVQSPLPHPVNLEHDWSSPDSVPRRLEMRGWCEANCQGKWQPGREGQRREGRFSLEFQELVDAISFKLRWG